jgi:hypothetical protein
MNGRNKRKKKAQRNRDTIAIDKRIRDPWRGMCPNGCGEPGPHFVPPGFGSPGVFVCTPKENHG